MKLIKIGLILLLLATVGYQAKTYYNNRNQENSGNAPIISSDVDEILIPCQYTKEDLLQGLSAYDIEDGYITDKILIGGFSNFTERGVSSLEYAVYDKDGNIAVFNRKVVFSDYIPPRITIGEPCVFKPANNEDDIPHFNLKGVDKLDGDISKHILVTGENIDFSKPGKYTVSAYAKNSFGDEVTLDIPVHVLDPRINGYTIRLKKPLIYVNKGAFVKPERYIDSVRNEYTNIIVPDKEYKLKIKSGVDTSRDGIYEIKYSVVSRDKVQRGQTWMTVVVGDYGG